MDSASLAKPRYITAVGASVSFVITESYASAGSLYFTCWTLAITSVIARSAFAFRRSRAFTTLLPCVVVDVMYSMPSAVAIDCAIGVVTKPCISSCDAPG
ncbi:Uncharacterised protein [Burkholderia pseudomallei]|nr:Uncharacterised protein [Burkholderia pseudomallei]CAK0369209.1 Uncharacterised protein [Burkholderia pseudomallei]